MHRQNLGAEDLDSSRSSLTIPHYQYIVKDYKPKEYLRMDYKALLLRHLLSERQAVCCIIKLRSRRKNWGIFFPKFLQEAIWRLEEKFKCL